MNDQNEILLTSSMPFVPVSMLERLIAYPDKPFDWSHVSSNYMISTAFIEQNLSKPWEWSEISRNPNITCSFVEKYIDKPWSWSLLSSNESISTEFVKKHLNKPWHWNRLCRNKNVDVDKILETTSISFKTIRGITQAMNYTYLEVPV